MPRRKAEDRGVPVKTRSRAGCSACRASRVRCDTKKPACTRCQERGLVCSTQLVLKWESEFVSRGLAFGRAGVWSKPKAGGGKAQATPSPPSSSCLSSGGNEWCVIPKVEPWGFINSFVGGFEQPYLVDVRSDDSNAVVAWENNNDNRGAHIFPSIAWKIMMVQQAGPKAPLSLLPHLIESSHGHLFEYYLQQMCPHMIASSNSSSPFASIIVPFCLTATPTLLKAIQALGACYRSRFNPAYSIVGLRLKSQVIRDLQNKLATVGPLSRSSDPELLIIMMMLCLYELVDHCDERWTIHLRGAKELIRLRRQQNMLLTLGSSSENQVISFAEHFFAFHDVMGRTACGEKALFGSDYWQDDDHMVDVWMGCSPELVSILSSVTELNQSRRHQVTDSALATISLKAATLGRQLDELVQDVDNGDEDLRTAAELKRLAAIVYLHCALHNASPSTTLVVSNVRKILKLVSGLLSTESLANLAWPVFVAAVELDPSNDSIWKKDNGEEVYGRPLVLRALAAMSESSVLSVARTRAVIVKVWQARDSSILKSSSRNELDNPSSCSDWELYVAPFSTAMSLA